MTDSIATAGRLQVEETLDGITCTLHAEDSRTTIERALGTALEASLVAGASLGIAVPCIGTCAAFALAIPAALVCAVVLPRLLVAVRAGTAREILSGLSYVNRPLGAVATLASLLCSSAVAAGAPTGLALAGLLAVVAAGAMLVVEDVWSGRGRTHLIVRQHTLEVRSGAELLTLPMEDVDPRVEPGVLRLTAYLAVPAAAHSDAEIRSLAYRIRGVAERERRGTAHPMERARLDALRARE